MRRVYLAMAVALGCSQPLINDSPTDPGEPQVIAEGLQQIVTIDPVDPSAGQTIRIRSVIRNTSSTSQMLQSRICGLDFAGSLELVWPPNIAKCAGYSMTGSVAAGDSVVAGDIMNVNSPPGAYVLRIRHAIEPEGWYELSVVVK